MSTSVFLPTHDVPAAGMPTWPEPDPNAAAGPSLAGKTQVQVLDMRSDGWAHVRCDNGWEAWVDGRLLTQTVPTRAVVATAAPNPIAAVGVVGVIVATFLPWVTVPGGSMTAWEMPTEFLLGRADDLGGPKVGLLLVVAVGITLVPFVSKVRLPWYATVSCAALAVEAVLMTLLRTRALTIDASIGVGAVVALLGAAAMAIDAGMAATRK
jgi:hypothetical protein